MKKLVGLMLAVMMALTVMLPLTALAEEPVTISFFDKNSGQGAGSAYRYQAGSDQPLRQSR